MWPEIRKNLPKFSSAVLTAIDDTGMPFSVRIRPVLLSESEGLALALPAYLSLASGPAGLLFHRHDARLGKLYSFVLRGALVRDGDRWLFQPEQYIPGMGMSGILSYPKMIREGRRTAARYLAKRNLPRPVLRWEELLALFR